MLCRLVGGIPVSATGIVTRFSSRLPAAAGTHMAKVLKWEQHCCFSKFSERAVRETK